MRRHLCVAMAMAAALVVPASFAAVASAATGAPAQDGAWTWQNPWPTAAAMNDVTCLPSGRTIIACSGPTFLSTDDGGQSWQYPAVTGADPRVVFLSLSFTDASHGWAVGDVQVAESVFGRRNVLSLHSLSPRDLGSPSFSVVARSTDAGSSWQQQTTIGNTALASVCFTSDARGWVVGASLTNGPAVLRTDDGGDTWNRQTLPDQENPCLAASFVDDLHGSVVCGSSYAAGCKIFSTSDGGSTWTQTYSSEDETLSTVRFLKDGTGWAVGRGGLILRSTDAGASWQAQEQYDASDLTCVWPVDDQHVVAAGDRSITRTTDGGLHWYAKEHPDAEYYGVAFSDADHGWVIGSDIERTVDGKTWQTVSSGPTDNLADVVCVDASTAWAIGEWGDVLQTTDGGQTWLTRRPQPTRLEGIYRALAVRGQGIWAVSDDDGLLSSLDGGQTWHVEQLMEYLSDVAFSDATTGWVVGDGRGGGAVRTTDGGLHWKQVWRGDALVVDCSGRQSAWVGTLNRLLRTTDGGRHWKTFKLPKVKIATPQGTLKTSALVTGLSFLDARHGWMVSCPYVIAGDWHAAFGSSASMITLRIDGFFSAFSVVR